MIIASALPKKVLKNDDFESMGWSDKKIFSKTGIKERKISDLDQTALDLAKQAGVSLIQKKASHKDKIDYLIYCTQSPDFTIPNNASLLHLTLGLSEECACVDINQGCTGYLYGLSLAKSLLLTEQATNVLLVTTDTYTKYINSKDRANRTIFGDGATATLLNKLDAESLGAFVFGTDGSGAFNLCVKASGFKYPKSEETKKELSDESGNIRSDENLYMNGAEVFTFTLKKVPEAVEKVIIRNNVSFDEIDHFIFHQANGFMLEHLRDKIGIPLEKFPIKMTYTGNTVSSSIPLVLEEMIKSGQVKSGQRCLLVGFGVGYSWAATLLTIN